MLSRIPEPEGASRPFDRRRDGLVVGEGAAAFVLESLEAAERRGARIWAEVAGYGCTSDASHIVRPDMGGQVRAMEAALASAGIAADEVDCVNAHGTATELADVVEAQSLTQILGPRTSSVPVASTKAQLGHLMGATAGVELATAILALHHGLVPPSLNLDDPDPRALNSCARPAASPERRPQNSFLHGTNAPSSYDAPTRGARGHAKPRSGLGPIEESGRPAVLGAERGGR